jgi:hypothetical protein
MFNLSISSLSTVYIQTPVSATIGGAVYNPTSDVVKMAFMLGTTKPGVSDWKTGSWDTAPGPSYMAQVLVGPGAGGVALGTGVYAVWIQISDSPETPVSQVGYLTIE